MINIDKGSEWRKWDLHVHTPSSHDYKNKSVKDEEIINSMIQNNVSVIAITDHNIIDISRIKSLKKLANNDVTILPGIELCTNSRGNDPIHIIGIFSEDIDINYVWNEINSKSDIAKQKHDGKKDNEIYCIFEQTCDLIHGLGGLISIHSGSKSNSIECISNSLPVKMAEKTDLVKYIDIFELGKSKDAEDYNKIVFPKIGIYPMVICSDNHNINDYSVKDNCWIKSDPTFEGLKQIKYEPENRIKIQEQKPVSPVRKVSEIKLAFNKDTKIKPKDKSEIDTFCFAGINTTLKLSDYFNCFIGGRGTGKSTLLNLIYKSFNKDNNTKYFNENKIILNDKEVTISDNVALDCTAEKIEFLEQNQIESFATDPIEFTKAIYNRLKNINIEENESILTKSIKDIDEQIRRIQNQHVLAKEIDELSNNYKATKKVTDTLDNKDYKDISDNIQILNTSYLQLKYDREKVETLRKDINEFILSHTKYRLNANSSSYLNSFNNFIESIQILSTEILDDNNFIKLKTEEQDLLGKITEQKDKLESFLKEQGLSEDNLEDLKTASTKADEYKNEIEKKNTELDYVTDQINHFSTVDINTKKEYLEKLLNERISEFKVILDEVNKNNPKDVDQITLSLSFNYELANANLCSELISTFDIYKNKYKYISNSDICQCLLKTNPNDIINGSKKYDDLKISIKGNNQYNQLLNDIFHEEFSFNIYKYIIYKHYFNICEYLKIDVNYRNKSLNLASFGQKCTAVIIIMLLFGHNPVIIDEPEAHLDSSLIANYLVNLISKEKYKRQIIFATHNANFVINADSEQIYILEMPDKITQFTQTTIENNKNRNKLLKLEGGPEAFEKREDKYCLNEL